MTYRFMQGVGAYNAGDIQRAITQFKSAAPSKGVLFNLGTPTHSIHVLKLCKYTHIKQITWGSNITHPSNAFAESRFNICCV